ncbi:MAG: beta-lactamase family protein [Clostridia bacterium]|nr:beta-lactamase family protein [Clostridia bacterium]
MLEYTKKFCDSFLEKGVPYFDLAIFKDGKSLLRYSGGHTDPEKKIPVSGKERYNIYSCSKPITCTAALMLWEKGLFSLDDRLSDYMPEFSQMYVKTEDGVKKAENPILIHHLFEMTAGFSYNVFSPVFDECRKNTDGKCPTREAIKCLAKDPLLFEPGTKWEYSLCHDVLAALVEVISGEKFEDFVKKNIFDVLGMKDSTFMLPENELDTIAPQYAFQNGKAVAIAKNIRSYKLGAQYASGGAGGISTVDDYIKFLEGLRTYKLLKPETLTLMTTDRTAHLGRVVINHGYGLGVRCSCGIYGNSDFGWGGAASAYLAVDMENALSVYIGMHLLGSPVQGARSMLYNLIRAELFEPSYVETVLGELTKLHGYELTY